MILARYVFLIAGALSMATGGTAAVESPVGPMTIEAAWMDAHRLAARHPNAQVVRVEGDSMQPFFGDHSLLVMKPVACEQLQPGMVVAYLNRFGERVAHRIEGRDEGGWIVRGYNNLQEDSTRVDDRNLLGVVYATFYSNGRAADPAALAGLLMDIPVMLAAPAR